ncbi:hypothetical protein, partial [Haloferula sp. A504]|uniref:hypothetical protein n=1 Tax=Haloferula sp. A504 TaxID=3373601 RepID=UPI0031C06D92|nr:hypothetical protein [Verrucomicrobiaceae bacterium E54]
MTVDAPTLSYGTLDSSGNKVDPSSGGIASVSTGSTLSGYLDDGDTLWFSVLVTAGNLGTNQDFGFALGTDPMINLGRVPLSNNGNGLGFEIYKTDLWTGLWVDGAGNTRSGSKGGVVAGTTYLVVGEMIFGATDTINIYLPDAALNQGSVVASNT